jgi:hypothetical protein
MSAKLDSLGWRRMAPAGGTGGLGAALAELLWSDGNPKFYLAAYAR